MLLPVGDLADSGQAFWRYRITVFKNNKYEQINCWDLELSGLKETRLSIEGELIDLCSV